MSTTKPAVETTPAEPETTDTQTVGKFAKLKTIATNPMLVTVAISAVVSVIVANAASRSASEAEPQDA